MTQTGSSEAPKDASESVVAQHAETLEALPFSDTRDFEEASRGFRHAGECADHVGAGQGGLESRALRLSFRRKSAADGRSEPVAAVASQHEPRTLRGRARRLSGQGPRYRQHDAD